jgi:hypothetical protein
LKSFGSSKDISEVEVLVHRAKQYIREIQGSQSQFIEGENILLESYLSSISNSQIQVIGPELMFGRIYDYVNINDLDEIPEAKST